MKAAPRVLPVLCASIYGDDQAMGKKLLPIVAILGRPNVGKSTLMNRIAARMTAIVDPTPGVTRDRKYTDAKWRDRKFIVADTGGVGIDTDGWLARDIERQAFFVAEEAEVVIMLVDVTTGITEDDEWLARKLKKMGLKVILAVNKVDNESLENECSVFYSLGLGDPIPISAYHGRGIGELLDRLIDFLPPALEEAETPEISVAIVGRPNVGKSSILNRLAGEERALVHEEPHTTRDTVDTVIEYEGSLIRILDTAGLRRKRTAMDAVEYYSSVRTLRAIDEANVVLLIIDASEGPTEHDQRIAGKIDERGKGIIALLNKWDIVKEKGEPGEIMESVSHKFRYAQHIPLLRVSALTGWNTEKIIPLVREVYGQWTMKIPTPSLNALISNVKKKKKPPSKGGKTLKMYYATQVKSAPPTFLIFVNDPDLVKDDYRRFIVNQLREEYGFWGSPIRLIFRKSN